MLNHLVFFCFFFLRLGLGQRRAVVIIGRWLLPSLVDTADICCHYWQHILVSIVIQVQWKFSFVLSQILIQCSLQYKILHMKGPGMGQIFADIIASGPFY